MTEIYLIRQGKALLPVNDSDAEAIQKLKHGTIYKADVTAPRNLKFHRKLFALLNETFSHWEPSGMIASVEKQTTERFGKFLIRHGVSSDAVSALQSAFFDELEFARQHTNGEKCFESFREWVTIESGFYNVILTPAGPRKVAKSISFAKMDEVEFSDLYKQILNTCWMLCLDKIYDNQERLAERLLSFE